MKTKAHFLVIVVVSGLLLTALAFTVAGQRSRDRDPDAEGQWEYMVVAGGNGNLTSVGNDVSGLRKQPDQSFSREFIPLERNFDKLGAKGWELVTVFGNDREPIYFFKRRKEMR